jgi:hydroxymethylbilane synthase
LSGFSRWEIGEAYLDSYDVDFRGWSRLMVDSARKTLRLGARGSLLSRKQSETVAAAIEAMGEARISWVPVTTSGDVIQDRPLHEFGGKGLFTRELEQALRRGEVDFAVHSYKDVPVTMPLVDTAELVIAAVPAREDPRDVLIAMAASNLNELVPGARVGTSSLRRAAQVLAQRPDVQILPIRGNIDTRLRKLREGAYDAVILAMAGVKRAGLFDPEIMTPIDTAELLPAAGQGALALECRRDAAAVREVLGRLNDEVTALATTLEREVVRLLNGDCHSPIAALATVTSAEVTLWASVAGRDGHPPVVRETVSVPRAEAHAAPQRIVEALRQKGADQLLGSGR